MQALDHLLPISALHSRLEKHRDQLRLDLAALPWWQWRRRLILSGSIAAYSYEIEQLLNITSQWQPLWDSLSSDNKPEGRAE